MRGRSSTFVCRWSANFRSRTRWSPPALRSAPAATPDAVFAALEHLEGAKGRLERVGERNGAPIFVDYAHKPDALAKALQALRPYATRKLVVVFGAGGDRDRRQAPADGRDRRRQCRHRIVTDDNPRSEDPGHPAGLHGANNVAGAARARGARGRRPRRGDPKPPCASRRHRGDTILIAGKGHETGQIVGDRTLPFSDHDAVASALSPRVA